MHVPVAIVPIRDFDGMTRLSPELDSPSRTRLARQLAESVISAVRTSGLSPLVVTSSDAVKHWAAYQNIDVCHDPDDGLSHAAATGVSFVGRLPWLVIHADLPLITASAVSLAATATENSVVLVPSQDGGTTVIGGAGKFPFSYGAGSFHRHLASAPHANVIVTPALSVDLDTPRHLKAFPDLDRS